MNTELEACFLCTHPHLTAGPQPLFQGGPFWLTPPSNCRSTVSQARSLACERRAVLQAIRCHALPFACFRFDLLISVPEGMTHAVWAGGDEVDELGLGVLSRPCVITGLWVSSATAILARVGAWCYVHLLMVPSRVLV